MRRPLAAAALLLLPAALPAQVAGARTEQLAEGVYAVLRSYPADEPSDANTLVIVNDADVIVVDANITTASSRRVIEEIRTLTPKPVRYVITTHFHSDHHYGNQAYREAYPGVEFVAHAMTHHDVVHNDIPAFEENIATGYPKLLASLRESLATGARADGTKLTAADSARTVKRLSVYEFFWNEAKTFQIIPPTVVLSDSLVLRRGDRTIVVRHLGRANTRGDLVVWLPNERILATGDVVVAPVPFGFGSFLGEWTGVLKRLKEYPAQVILPGHGAPMRDWRYVDQVNALLESTLAQVKAASAGGTSLEEVRKVVTLADWRERFAGSDALSRRAFDSFWIAPAIERANLEARGELPR